MDGTCTYSVTLSFHHSIIIHFLMMISTTIAHIQLKFDTLICLINTQVEFEYSFGSMIFDFELCHLNLKKIKWEIYFPIIISTTFAHIELLLKFDYMDVL